MLRRTVVNSGLGLVLLLVPIGCGTSDPSPRKSTAAPDHATSDCRAQWKQLGSTIATDTGNTTPSALPERWNSLAATVDYYRTSATSKDCGDRLDAQHSAITALRGFSAKLVAFDVPAQLAKVKDDATSYASGPWPAAPRPTKKGDRKSARPPKPAVVRHALADLAKSAPLATTQQNAGWQQASVTDLDNTAAVAKAVKDLRFLSSQSSAYRRATQDLTVIRKALAAKQ